MGYLECQKSKGFKLGDKVRVIRKAENGSYGWDNSWVANMDKFIGQVCEIVDVSFDRASGIALKLDGEIWHFPYFVLEKVETTDTDYSEVNVCANLTDFDSTKSRALLIPELLRKFGKHSYTLEEVLEIIQYM